MTSRAGINVAFTSDDRYNQGYEDGKKGRAANASFVNDHDYEMGFEDGRGDYEMNKPSGDVYADVNPAPEGFAYTGEKRVPDPYEFYVSKMGRATYLDRPRKNSQTRHILKCANCGSSLCWRGMGAGITRCWCDHPGIK